MGAVEPEDFFEIGLIVTDLEQARAELTATLGITFTDIMDGFLPMRDAAGNEESPRLRMCYSRQFPYLEVIEEQPGTRLTKPAGTALHHLGAWTDDLQAASAELEAKGFPLVTAGLYDGEWPAKWTYHMTSFGTLIELLDRSSQPAVEKIIRDGSISAESLAEIRGGRASLD